MSNDKNENVYERLFRLWSAICKMIVDGVRDPKKVADVLQTIIDQVAAGKAYLRRLYKEEVIKVGDMTFAVYEMIENGNFAQLFGSLGDINELAFASRAKVDEFCRLHANKLRQSGYATFFLFRGKNSEFCVANVGILNDGFRDVLVFSFESGRIWDAEDQRRIVVPQQ